MRDGRIMVDICSGDTGEKVQGEASRTEGALWLSFRARCNRRRRHEAEVLCENVL